MRTLLLLAALIAPSIVAQDVVFIGRRQETWGQPAPVSPNPPTARQIQLYRTSPGSLTLAPGSPVYGPNDGGSAMVAFQKNGRTYLVIAQAGATNIAVMEYDATTVDTPVKHTIALGGNGASDMAYAQATEILYFARKTATINSTVNSFNEVWSVDLKNVASSALPAPQKVATLPRDCFNARVTPDGKRLLLKCFSSTLLDLNVSSGAIQSYGNLLPGHDRGDLAIEPAQGKFAYSVGTNAPFDIAMLDLGNLGAAPTTINLGFGVGISFHPTGKWAYFWSGSGTQMLETGPGGTPPVSGLVSVPANSFYGILVGGDRAYALSLTANGSDYIMGIFQIDQVTGQLSQVGSPVTLGGDQGAPQGAIVPVFPVKVNTSLDTTLLDPVVGIDNIDTATDEYTNPNVPTGPITVTAPATVPEGTDIEWRLASWSVDGTVDPTMSNNPKAPVDVVAPGGKTYTANYEKWVRIVVDNQGCSVVNTSTGFFKLGSDPLLHVEPATNGTIVSLEFFPAAGGGPIVLANDTPLAITEPGTVKTTCNPPAPPGTPVTLLVSPANLSTLSSALPAPVKVSITNGGTNVPAPWTGNVPGTSQTLSVSNLSPEIPNHTRYTFGSWTPASNGAPGTATATLPNNGTPSTFIANYTPVAFYVTVVNNGCPASTVTWTSPAGFVGNAYAQAGVNLFATFPSVTSATVETIDPSTGNFGPAFPASALTMLPNGPVRLTINCSAPGVTVLVRSNLPPTTTPGTLTATQVGNPNSPASGPVGSTVTLNNVSATPNLSLQATTPITAGTIQWLFKGWSLSSPSTTYVSSGNPYSVPPPATATTYVANYDLNNQLVVVIVGSCSVTPLPGYYPNNSTQTLVVTPSSSFVNANYWAGTGSAVVPLNNGGTFSFVGGTLTVNCGMPLPTSYTVTLNSAAPGCNATVSSPGLPGPSYPSGSPITVTMPSATGLSNVQVTVNGITTTYTSFPATFTLLGNATVKTDCNSPATACIAQPAGIIGWYPIDGPQVPFTDLIAPASPMGTQNGGVAATGKVAGGFDFIFASGFLLAGSPAKYNFGTGDFAVSGWFKMTAPNAGPYSIIRKNDNNNGFDVKLDNGKLRLDLTSAGTTTTWNGAKSVIDLNWHHIVVNVGRTSNTLQFIVDGLLDTVTGPALATFTGAINTGQQFTVAGFNLVADEVQIFSQPVSISDAQKLYLADSFGVCKPSTGNVNVTVITNPASVQAQVGIGGGKSPGIHQDNTLAGGSTQTVSADDPFLGADGNYYRFTNWTPIGPGVTLPATGSVTYTANYSLIGGQVDVSGCGITVGPTSRQISANPLIFSFGGPLTINAVPPAGQVFQGFTVTPFTGGAATTYATTPLNLPFNGPIKIVANCGAAANIDITLVSNPPTGPTQLGITSGIATPVGPGPRILNIPPTGSTPLVLGADPQFVASGTGYRFSNFTPGPFAANPATVLPKPTASTIYTANYTAACYVLTLESTPAAGGTASLNPAAGNVAGFPANCYSPNTVVTMTSQPATGYGHNSFGGTDIVNTSATTTTVTMNGPKTVKLFFDPIANHAVNVTTSPTGLTFAVDGTPSTTPVAVQWPALSTHKLEVTTPQLLAGSYYAFQRWTIATGTVSTLAVYPNAAVSKPENYTGVFDVLCHVLTVNASGGTVTRNPATGVSSALANCYAPGTQVTLTAAGTGTNTLTGWSGDAAGTTPSVTVTMNGPKTVTATFGAPANVTLTLLTVPAGLSARIGAATVNNPLAATPISQSVPVNTSQIIVVIASVTRNGTWYAFNDWSNGTNTPVSQAQVGTTSLTVTANYNTACHELTLSANPSAGGTVTANPASGNVTGFPSNCYAPGTTVTLTANPATGRVMQGWTGATPGSGNTATVVMSQPRTVIANFAQAPVLNPRTTSRTNSGTGVNTSLQIGNSGGAAVNLRITALTVLSPANVIWDQTAICTTCTNALPIVIGALPSGGDTGRNIGFRATSGSIAVPISYQLTLQADNLPATQFTIAVP